MGPRAVKGRASDVGRAVAKSSGAAGGLGCPDLLPGDLENIRLMKLGLPLLQ